MMYAAWLMVSSSRQVTGSCIITSAAVIQLSGHALPDTCPQSLDWCCTLHDGRPGLEPDGEVDKTAAPFLLGKGRIRNHVKTYRESGSGDCRHLYLTNEKTG